MPAKPAPTPRTPEEMRAASARFRRRGTEFTWLALEHRESADADLLALAAGQAAWNYSLSHELETLSRT